MRTIEDIMKDEELYIESNELIVKEQIGKGSFGIVRSALWRGTPIAVKEFQSDLEEECKKEIIAELDSLSRLHHPNIIQLLGVQILKKPYMIAMEYMPFSLENHIHFLRFIDKKSICIDIARGLAYIHNRKPDSIIHRDLKPSNILLTISLKAKLADFGLSILQKDNFLEYKMTGETGSYRYMAPEVLRHESYNSKVDIWSFGMVIYEIFIQKPYDNLSLDQMIHHIANYITPLYDKTKIKGLQDVLSRCLIKSKNRTKSINLIELLKKINNEDPILNKKSIFRCFR